MVSISDWKETVKEDLVGGKLFKSVLSKGYIEARCAKVGHTWRQSFWSPSVTVLTFLLQVLDPTKTVRAAVVDLLTQLGARGVCRLPSADPTAYCQARKRLPLAVVQHLLSLTARSVARLLGADARWHGHRVLIVDGSCSSMPDEAKLRAAYPQSPNQKKGCGFPLIRYVGLFCWSTGALVALKWGTYFTAELPLYRELWRHLRRGDLIVGDRNFGSYVDIARLRQRGVEGIYRLHKSRKTKILGKRLGPREWLVEWMRPRFWLASVGISRKAFERLPERMTLRLIRLRASRKSRCKTIDIVTTLLDPVEVPADEIQRLYRDRWMVELNFRHIKIALGMDVLRGKSVDVIHKELCVHLVVYNLIRLLMWRAAKEHGKDLHRLSFTGTLKRLHKLSSLFLLLDHLPGGRSLYDQVLVWIAADRIPFRPDRREPRCLKRRPKSYPRLTRPRHAVFP
jgi:DDE family transposase